MKTKPVHKNGKKQIRLVTYRLPPNMSDKQHTCKKSDKAARSFWPHWAPENGVKQSL